MRATLRDQAIGSVSRSEDREPLAKYLDRLDGPVCKFRNGGHRLPETPHVRAHRRSGPDERQAILTLFARGKMIEGCGHGSAFQ
jgi:hypothetical protein